MSEAAPWHAVEPAAGSTAPVETSKIVWGFRVINIGLCAMMCATGVISISEFSRVTGTGVSGFFIALYLILFSTLWFLHEWMSIRPVDRVLVELKRNFGFLFRPVGKGLFIIFCAFLNFGVKDKTLGLTTGILCTIDGVLLIVLYLKYPHWYPHEP